VRRCTSIRAGFKTTEGSNNASSNARAIENHADCLAGVWAHSYYRKGRLDRRAILEGMNIAHGGPALLLAVPRSTAFVTFLRGSSSEQAFMPSGSA
jgi:predicted metalloprotease